MSQNSALSGETRRGWGRNNADPMKRLPGYDRSTSLSEWAAFGCLGAVAVATIFLSLPSASRFAQERDDVITAWSLTRAAEPVLAAHRTNHVFTGAAQIPTALPVELPLLIRSSAMRHGCPAPRDEFKRQLPAIRVVL